MVADILFLHVSLHMVAEHFDLKYQEDLTGLEVKWIKHERFCVCSSRTTKVFDNVIFGNRACARNQQ